MNCKLYNRHLVRTIFFSFLKSIFYEFDSQAPVNESKMRRGENFFPFPMLVCSSTQIPEQQWDGCNKHSQNSGLVLRKFLLLGDNWGCLLGWVIWCWGFVSAIFPLPKFFPATQQLQCLQRKASCLAPSLWGVETPLLLSRKEV